MPIQRFRLSAIFLLFGASLILAHASYGEGGDIPRWQPSRTGLGYEVDLAQAAPERPTSIHSREVEARGLQPL